MIEISACVGKDSVKKLLQFCGAAGLKNIVGVDFGISVGDIVFEEFAGGVQMQTAQGFDGFFCVGNASLIAVEENEEIFIGT